MIYSFHEQLSKGELGESLVAKYFSSQYEIVKATPAQQRLGIDLIFVDRQSRRQHTLQIKTDFKASETGKAFIEKISVDDSGGLQKKDGWVYTSTAKWLFYYIPKTSILYVLKLETLRAVLPDLDKKYPTKKAQNYGYNTHGVCVPLTELEKLSSHIFILDDNNLLRKATNSLQDEKPVVPIASFAEFNPVRIRREVM